MSTSTSLDFFKRSYASQLSSYDELISGDKQIHGHWSSILEKLLSEGEKGLSNSQAEIDRLLRENGVTYNVYGDPKGLNRTWKLDPIPFILNEKDWYDIERGLKQRAELLNLIYIDLYSKRNLIQQGILPAELIFANKSFLRPCDQVMIPGDHQLLVYAADMARGPDGRMWVLNDKTQAPSGSGYALENRFMLRRVLPDLFNEASVRRLSYYFQAIRNLFPRVSKKENPNVVILTPGPSNETYFEHAFLASYLGYNLTQGEDLTVRDNKVFLKTMGGLEQVDIIIRRVDDHYCDPLELKENSYLGVAGLLQAARSGNVVIANPLGSGVLENPGLMAFMPSLCKHFLGEDPILPTAATWWCGQKKEMNYVLENLDKLVIKCIDPSMGSSTVFGSSLSKMKLDNWRKRIQTSPHLYVGQEQVDFSTSPSFINGQIQPRYSVIRSFLVSAGNEYEVMPGGLTRNSSEKGSLYVSNQTGGTSKDTWILLPEPDVHLQVSPHVTSFKHTSVFKGLEAMPSRTAENLYWVGRYIERSKSMARLLRTIISKLLENSKSENKTDNMVKETLLTTLTQVTMTYPGFMDTKVKDRFKKPESELLTLATQLKKTGSLAAIMQSMLFSALAVRDRWSVDSLRILDTFKDIQDKLVHGQDLKLSNLLNIIDEFSTASAAFVTFNRESMSQEQGLLMFDTGRRIERILQLTYILRSSLVMKQSEAVEHILLESILTTKESLSTYRYQYRTQIGMENVMDLLLLDKSHPSSLTYQLDRLYSYFGLMPHSNADNTPEKMQSVVIKMHKSLSEMSLSKLCDTPDDNVIRESFDTLLHQLSEYSLGLSTTLSANYFTHLNYSHRLLSSIEKES